VASHYNWTSYIGLDPPDHVILTAGALSSLPLLKTLVVNIQMDLTPSRLRQTSTFARLRDFKNLCTLFVSCDHDIPRAYCLQEIAPAINASPSLANLSIRTFYTLPAGRVTTCTSLQLYLRTSKPELVQLELAYVPPPSAGIREILSPSCNSYLYPPFLALVALNLAGEDYGLPFKKLG
jgi:hypothetical protein